MLLKGTLEWNKVKIQEGIIDDSENDIVIEEVKQ
jgi:hypothetical protein|tara:strand:- start:1002 stop:1103 length:102 start_codon:yes stop_codon:yes gene_type:complete